MRFRAWIHNQDPVSAQMFFRNLTEEHYQSCHGVRKDTDFAGLPGIDPLYKYSFPVIPVCELEIESFRKPLGKGQNGSVYAAKWTMPVKMLSTSEKGRKDVVLKDVLEKDGAGIDFFREVSRILK